MAISNEFANLIRDSIIYGTTFHMFQAKFQLFTDKGTQSSEITCNITLDNPSAALVFTYTHGGTANEPKYYFGQTATLTDGFIDEMKLWCKLDASYPYSHFNEIGMSSGTDHNNWTHVATEAISQSGSVDYNYNDFLQSFTYTFTPATGTGEVLAPANLLGKFNTNASQIDITPNKFTFYNDEGSGDPVGLGTKTETTTVGVSVTDALKSNINNISCEVGVDDLPLTPTDFKLFSAENVLIDSGDLTDLTEEGIDWLAGDSLVFTYVSALLKKIT